MQAEPDDLLTAKQRLAKALELAPESIFPGTRRWGWGMVTALCPLDRVAACSESELARKLAQIDFERKQSTPWDDDDYWMAQSPFDGRFYVFALLSIASGPPGPPAYVLDQRPISFDED